MPEDASNSLNANHERRLSVTCRHIDKLLSDMEGALNASASRMAFPQYVSDIAPAQRRVIEDYITRIRAQLVRVLDGQHIERPVADIPVSRSLHAVLTFIDIAAEELKPEYMRGYGEVPAAAAVELNGIAGELRGLVNQLDQYVTQGSKEDLQKRLDRCDLGVALIDAGSTLTPDDLQTIQILYEAAIPATVLLSKADLLGPQDRARIIEYVKQHIKSELDLDLPVHPVSVMPQGRDLLGQWFTSDIAPLYNQRQELKLRSVRRKIGALRQSVEFALRSRLRRKDQLSPQKVEQLREVEKELRQASGKLEEVKKIARQISDEIDVLSRKAIRQAAASVVEFWESPAGKQDLQEVVVASLTQTVEEKTEMLRRFMAALAHELHDSLESTAKVLNMKDGPAEAEVTGLLREMPAFDLGDMRFSMKRPYLVLLFGHSASESVVANRLTQAIGPQLSSAISAYRALLHDWAERTLTQIQRRFDAYANGYRAQAERSIEAREIAPEHEELIRRDLEAIEASRREEPVAS